MAGIQVRPNMFQTFDYGSAVQAGQQIQENRLRNQALADDQQQRADMLKNRAKAAEIRKMYDDMPSQIEALEAEDMYEQADDLRNRYIKARINENQLLGTMRNSIDETNYKSFREQLLKSGAVTPDMMPVEYSDDWFRKEDDKQKGALNKFTRTSYEKGANMSQDVVHQDGAVRWDLTGEWYDIARDKGGRLPGKDGAGSGSQFEFKAADTNAIGKQAAEVYGGFWDPVTQRPTGLDAEKAAKVQAVREQASRIFAQERKAGNAGFSHATAVARASRQAGVNVRDLGNSAATNPLGMPEDVLRPPAQ